MKLELGIEIYYTGDMANISGFGKITAANPPDTYAPAGTYNITLEDGRVFKMLYPAMFDPGPGRRFIPRTEYEADRKARAALDERSLI